MFKTLAAALTIATALAVPTSGAFASSSQAPSKEVALQIRTTLTEQGYDVRKIKMEDGQYEAYVIKDGQRLELYLNAEFEIVRQKTDD